LGADATLSGLYWQHMTQRSNPKPKPFGCPTHQAQ
jgi:hypothetical protein